MLSISSVKRLSSVSIFPVPLPKFIAGEMTMNSGDFTSKPLECQNVRISPNPMVFENAFEGKSYHQKFTIQNLGKNAAFIRICPASSYAFQINRALVRGKKLCPGLSITRFVSFTYMRATSVPFATIRIHINDEAVEYKLIVLLSGVAISAIPQQIDFGIIDAGHSAAVRMLSLRNDGSKGTRFAIDLGRNEIELVVEPGKGIIQPHDTVTFRIECLGTIQGSFAREFWIKCETPIRIPVTGTIIAPEFLPFHPNMTEDFTLVNFPKTYFGTSCITTMVIKNRSSTPAVYCTLAEFPNETMDLREASFHKPDYLSFKITPLEGTLHPHEGRIFNFKYTPIRDEKKRQNERYEKFVFCCLQIVRVPCADVGEITVLENVEVQEQDFLTRNPISDDTMSVISSPLSIDEDLSSLVEGPAEVCAHQQEAVSLKRSARIILFGEAEVASITIRPDSLSLLEIPNSATVTRELLLSNKSSSLPIIFSYKKVSFIEVDPKRGTLPPLGKLELRVTITPAKTGKVATKVAFDLLFYDWPRESEDYIVVGYAEVPLSFNVPAVSAQIKPQFNMGITPNYIKEVGFLTDDVRFNSPIAMPKATLMPALKDRFTNADDALIAFPNDRPKSLRPWKSPLNCRTICGSIPRNVNATRDKDYQLTKSKSDFKHAQAGYYTKFIREDGERLKQLRRVPDVRLPDYDLSSGKQLLLADAPKPKCPSGRKDETNIPSWYIPLTPLQLNKVVVHPRDITLNKMAPGTTETTTITIHNQNNFYLMVSAKARKPVITFNDNPRRSIKPFQTIKIKLTYHASMITGHYNVIIDFIINGSNTFGVSITVDIIPKCAKFFHQEILFDVAQNPGRYLDVFNPVNVPVDFQWLVPESCFIVEPSVATIPAYRHITCYMSYHPRRLGPRFTEITLQSNNKRKQTVSVSAAVVPPNVKLKSPKVEFKDMPLNLPVCGTTVLQNFGTESVTFEVLNPRPMRGVTIKPTDGTIHGLGEQIFDIYLQISACVSFSCKVEIEVEHVITIKLELIGSVVYPNIEIKPQALHLQKIVANAFDRQVFVATNKSKAVATVDFLFQDFSEYAILESRNFDGTAVPILKFELEPNEHKELYLHFNPMGAASYCSFLPIVINGILGPPNLHVGETLKPAFYTEAIEIDYLHSPAIKAKSLTTPKQIPLLAVNSAVGGDTVRFSKLRLNFRYFPHPDCSSENQVELKIWNGSKDTCQFCIRTDNLKPPFSLTYLSGNELTVLEYSLVCVLGVGEDVTLKAEFLPDNPGHYHIQLPIYVRKYLEGNVFNYLTFSGWYPKPIITALESDICFEPVPLRCETEYCLFLKTEFHQTRCQIVAKTDTNDLRVTISESVYGEDAKSFRELRVVLKYSIKDAELFHSIVGFFCECGAECYVNIRGCADNCTVTTHAYVRAYIKTLFDQPIPIASQHSYEDLDPNPTRAQLEYVDTLTMSTIFSTSNLFDSLTNYNETAFPMFPDDHDETDYAKYMRSCVTALEEWLFHQGFYGKYYCKIPEGIALVPECTTKPESEAKGAQKNKKEKPKKPASGPKFVELLKNLIGPQVKKYLPSGEMPGDNLGRVNYLYNVYSMAKKLIENQGGLLPHVFPQNLLTYKDYATFRKSIYPFRPEFAGENVPELLNENNFYLISKQSWLDIVLQTYKVFVLVRVRYPNDLSARITDNETPPRKFSYIASECSSNFSVSGYRKATLAKESIASASDMPSRKHSKRYSKHLVGEESTLTFAVEDTAFWRYVLKAEPRNNNIFGSSEVILLHWLEFHFNNQREDLWDSSKLYPGETTPEPRNLKFFDVDLSDGLALIAVTAACCPYLRPYLYDIYTNPTCLEQAFHNVSKLLQTWKMINLSFTLTPRQIVIPNPLQMLMLVNYLYEVLPNFYPYSKLHLKTGLSTTFRKEVILENLSDSPITYNVILFGNERGLFSVSKNPIALSPKEKTKVAVIFNAKNICLLRATMVFNGETFGRCYARTMAFTLLGESIPSNCTSTVTIPAPLYNIIEVELQIQSPYTCTASYDLNFSLNEPDDVTTCKIISWALAKKSKIPKRLISSVTQLDVDEEGRGMLSISVGCVTTNEKTIWAIFTNPEVGDFTVKVITIPETYEKLYTNVQVSLPKGFETIRCNCKGKDNLNKQCPRIISLRVPCRNDFLWNAVSELMMKIVDEKDLLFWKQYLGTTVGIQLKKWMTELEAKNETYYDIQEIFGSTVNYVLTPESDSGTLVLLAMTTIENVHSLEDHEIRVHMDSGAKRFPDFQFKMESERGLELRYYCVHFLSETQSDTSINDMPVNV